MQYSRGGLLLSDKPRAQYRIHTTVDCSPQLIFFHLLLNEAGSFNDAPIEVARLWQALVQDDDVRVPYGKAHDNARQIVEDYDALTLLNNKLKDLTEPKDISLLLCCLSSLSVRNEYCKKVADDGGLNIILKVLVDPDQDKNVIKESLKLVKTLAGNDDVKRDIGNTKEFHSLSIPFQKI
ncbi:armadillo repeat-containing protein 6-like [Lepeophtheirus salmonis]|uniref:armadillo repeat-containing protein 6-like n=1 Tax=Lepeophtheirus salmonis TaxID=72036 RepID=UPI003AF3D65E